jgi:hypothetical protein
VAPEERRLKATTRPALWSGLLRHRFALLFFVLLSAIGIQPALQALAPGVRLVGPVLALSLGAAVAGAIHERGFRLLAILAFGYVVLYVLLRRLLGESASPVQGAVWIPISALAMVVTARRAFRRGGVDSERIFSALTVYVMAGLIFAVGYWTVERVWPGSFGAPGAADLDLPGAIYFSFVTLATLGYGDITPVSEAARGFAILEAVAGQMYIAVLVARLVGLFTVSGDGRGDK